MSGPAGLGRSGHPPAARRRPGVRPAANRTATGLVRFAGLSRRLGRRPARHRSDPENWKWTFLVGGNTLGPREEKTYTSRQLLDAALNEALRLSERLTYVSTTDDLKLAIRSELREVGATIRQLAVGVAPPC